MGILSENLTWLLQYAKPPATILELGNQFLYINTKPFPWYDDKYLNPSMAAHVAAKGFFKDMGFGHVSVDINGEDGALALDLSKPFTLGGISPEFDPTPHITFDYITDFGTSEHIPSLWQCLENLHRHARVGTQFFHVNPLTGNWPEHGIWYRDEEFYEAFAKLTGYELLELKRDFACGNFTDGWNIWARLKKVQDTPFPTSFNFSALPVKLK